MFHFYVNKRVLKIKMSLGLSKNRKATESLRRLEKGLDINNTLAMPHKI